MTAADIRNIYKFRNRTWTLAIGTNTVVFKGRVSIIMTLSVLHMTTEYPPMTNGGIANAAFGMVSASVQAGIETRVIFIGHHKSEYGKQLSVPYLLGDGIS